MDITEKDLEDLIFDDLKTGGHSLHSRGFKISLIEQFNPNKVYWYRQVCLKGYGFADIIGFSRRHGYIHVEIIELKNRPIKCEDFDQVYRYRTAVETIIENTFKNHVSHRIHCAIVGPSIEAGHYIHNVVDCEIIVFKFSVQGFHFERSSHAWQRTDAKHIRLCDVKSGDEIILISPSTEITNLISQSNGQTLY